MHFDKQKPNEDHETTEDQQPESTVLRFHASPPYLPPRPGARLQEDFLPDPMVEWSHKISPPSVPGIPHHPHTFPVSLPRPQSLSELKAPVLNNALILAAPASTSVPSLSP